jgi:hypothetical protein
MAVGIGAAGFVGIALEATPGTYVAPEKYFPIRSESLSWTQNTLMRRVIRGTVDPIGAIQGNGNVEGNLDMELLDDVLPYLLLVARGDLEKTGTAPNFVYNFVANHAATPAQTASITVVRNGEVFGYVGCVVASMQIGTDDGVATMTVGILGTNEESEALPVPTYNPADQPFGSGEWVIEIPTTVQVFDTDNLTLSIEDNGEVQHRLKNTLGAQFISYGERSVQASVDRDFESRAEYDAFKTVTSSGLAVKVTKDANRGIDFIIPATIKESYDLSLSGPGDLIRASISYQGIHDATTGASYEIEVRTQEDVTMPA